MYLHIIGGHTSVWFAIKMLVVLFGVWVAFEELNNKEEEEEEEEELAHTANPQSCGNYWQKCFLLR